MSLASRCLRQLPRSGATLLRFQTPGPSPLATPLPATPVSLVRGFSSSIALRAKKIKKGNNKSSSQDVEDDATMVIRTKGKASRKSATLVSAAHSSTGSSRRGVAGEEPIEADVEAGEAHDDAVIEKAKVKMEKTVSWFKSVVFDGVERGKGRITPALLDPVRVQLPDYDTAEPLQSVASVTVKQGALWVEVYDPDTLKHVESAIHSANLPGISPQKDSSRTLRIPISRPSSETRTAIEKMIADQGEAAKIRLRGARTDALKALVDKDGRKGKWGTEAQQITDKFGAEIDALIASAKKELAKA
ncbi:hypothetical protein QFC20_004520 [Naganishia adeliensis]|uniref:Uncharacterized protein n=1 Tax=Naganishia adeliensis TaxID=92952 RepID=A0ACC2VZG2_9TREE|nr:hypothetical protein QFC20_004520 [Naganishia adeliensis]